MQVFGLINTLLQNDTESAHRNLEIKRYVATPLSYNSGLVEWVENTDTIHNLIKEYRESHGISLAVEQRLLMEVNCR